MKTKHIKRAYTQMKQMKEVSLINSSLDLHYKELNYSSWDDAKHEGYLVLYPESRAQTDEEMQTEYQEYLNNSADGENTIPFEDYEFTDIELTYQYCIWQDEVPEEGHYKDDGTYIIDTLAVAGYYYPESCTPTYSQWLNGETCPEYDTKDDVINFKSSDSSYKKYSKAQRDVAVSSIVVTTDSGNTFDGNEVSQTRMSRAVAALDDGMSTLWVLHDNTPASVTKEELREALRLSGEVQTKIWMGA